MPRFVVAESDDTIVFSKVFILYRNRWMSFPFMYTYALYQWILPFLILILLFQTLQRRQAIRDRFQLDEVEEEQEESKKLEEQREADGGAGHLQVFNLGGVTSRVTVAPLHVGSDSDRIETDDEESDIEGDAFQQGSEPTRPHGGNGSVSSTHVASFAKSTPTRLNKNALKVMTKTKLKIDGKKREFRMSRPGGQRRGKGNPKRSGRR